MNKYVIILLTIYISIISYSAYCQQKEIYFGVLEKRKLGWPNKKLEKNYFNQIRYLFHYKNNQWTTINQSENFPTYLNILFDMKQIGSVKLSESIKYDTKYKWGKYCYRIKKDNIPSIGEPGILFSSSFCGGETYRPLVALSEKNYTDPLKWKPSSFPYKYFDELYNTFISKLKAEEGINLGNDLSKLKEKIIIHKSYKDIHNNYLVHFELPENSIEYIEPSIYDLLHAWYYIKDNNMKYIGSYLQLIDAGDYDNDGNSDILFYCTGYNLDGYILYYNNLNKKVECVWSYH